MKKPQLIVIFIAAVLCVALIKFAPRTNKAGDGAGKENTENQTISTQSILDGAKTGLTGSQKISLLTIENQLTTAKTPAARIAIFKQLSQFWADSANSLTPYLYYTYSAALLENSEKSLTFAAQQFVDRIIVLDAKPEIQNWMAGTAKVLLEKALEINPNNDSSIINLGVCYTFADISNDNNQLMPTILRVKSVIDRNPDNELGQLVLGLGGIISKQYEKAIERFKNVLRLNPNNIFAYLNLAGCYELTNQNGLAIEIYTKLKGIANKPEARELYDSKIEELKKKN